MKFLKSSSIVLLAAASCASLAAPLDLSNVPLFASTNAPPANILFVFDDSGSMDWNTVTTEESGLIHIDGCSLAYTHPAPTEDQYRDPGDDSGNLKDYDNYYPVPPESAGTGKGFWRARTHHYNKLYYNPEVRYDPWKGLDDDNNAYVNATPSAARVNAYDASAGTFDLTSNTTYYSLNGFGCQNPDFAANNTSYYPARYWTWTDTDNDGNVDISEKGTLIEIRTSGTCPSGASCPSAFTRGEDRTDCAQLADDDDTTNQCTNAEELQNFANWYQYYRRREFTAKGAYTYVVDDAKGVNMGLITINNNNNVKTPLRLMSNSAYKTSLLDALSNINASGGTPLRQSAYEGYEYLSCDANDYFSVSGSNCPQATAAEGGACQQSFIVNMTDGYYYGGFNMPGTNNEDDNGDTDFDGGPYGDDYGSTMADIAMEFYEHDIATGLPDILPVILGVDEARHQHVTTYSVAFGVNGTLDAMPSPDTDGNSFWPDPQEDSNIAVPEKIDDLRHAAFNGRGLFLNASSPNDLIDALSDALLSIGDRASSAASVALNSSSLNDESHLFQARFDSGDWSGQLQSFPISDGKASQPSCSGVAKGELCPLAWDAGEVLKTQHWLNDREIITINPTTRTTGIPFVWDNLESSQKLNLRKHPDSGIQNNVNNGKRRWRFIRGREYSNRNDFRLRSSPLGDIVNSDPFFVGEPRSPYSFNSYAAFRSTHANRREMVYVGSNDGMLHGFDVATGREMISYIPGDRRIWDNLTTLASLSYASKHRYFVDGSATVGDVYFGTNGTDWKTVLVSGLRSGGQTIFALDVTNPEPAANGFDESNADNLVLWEFSDEDDKDLGFTFSQPNIVRMADGRWAAVIGNGYNNSDATGNETAGTTSTTGKGYLFILFMDGPGVDGNWDLGTDYIKLEVNSGSVLTPNGLAAPATVDTNGDFKIDLVYAGDLNGNMWRFDVSDPSPANWAVSYSGQPLFTARNAGNVVQPITVRPEISPHPDGLANGLIVLFGTGRYIDAADNSSTGETQSFYGIWDKNEASNVIPTRANLVQQQILTQASSSGTTCTTDDCLRVVSNNPVNLTDNNDRGWYLDLYNTAGGNTDNFGERAVSDPVLRSGKIVFTTLVPEDGACKFGGNGWLMELFFATGSNPLEPSLDINDDGHIDENDVITVTINGVDITVAPGGQISDVGIIPRPTILTVPREKIEFKYVSGSTGAVGIFRESGLSEGRLNWREVR